MTTDHLQRFRRLLAVVLISLIVGCGEDTPAPTPQAPPINPVAEAERKEKREKQLKVQLIAEQFETWAKTKTIQDFYSDEPPQKIVGAPTMDFQLSDDGNRIDMTAAIMYQSPDERWVVMKTPIVGTRSAEGAFVFTRKPSE